MIGRGRPLRFLAMVLSCWIGIRTAQLWPEATLLPGPMKALLPLPAAAQAASSQQPTSATPARTPSPPLLIGVRTAFLNINQPPDAPSVPLLRLTPPLAGPMIESAPLLGAAEYSSPSVAPPAPIRTAQPDYFQPMPDRWSASAWLVVRPGTGLGAAPGGSQLGGSQAGARLAWLLAPSSRVALFGRLTTPLRGRGAEAAAGVEWQPGKAPVRLLVERRVGIDGVRGGFGAGVVGGTDGPIASGFRLESYGQAGAIHRERLEPYADGAARITRQVAGSVTDIRLSIGAGAWGAIQRDASRLDIGPSVTLTLPVARQPLRVALDWRQRVAGDARPGSGVALTLGSDF